VGFFVYCRTVIVIETTPKVKGHLPRIGGLVQK
jgi:hypothetical protein